MLQLVVEGLALGCIYALLAVSTVLLLRVSGALTLATGDLVVFLAYLAVTFAVILQPPLPLWAAGVATIAIAGASGALIWWLTLRPLTGKPVVLAGLATIGIALALRRLAELFWGPLPQTLPSPVPAVVIQTGTGEIQLQALFVIAVTGLLLLAMSLVFGRIRRGTAVWRSIQPGAATRLGLAVGAGAAAISALAALLFAPGFVQAELGPLLLAKALAAVVLGGFGNMRAAVVGALLLGLLEAGLLAVLPVAFAQALLLLVPVAVVWLLPGGVLAVRAPERVAA